MTIQYPDYSNSLVSLACSILKHFGAQALHTTLPALDVLLEKQYKNVVVMIFDGMGSDALSYHLPEDSFLRRHCTSDISSVFPPTTTAAVTSVESGLTPVEHGWLGWSLYFSEIDKIVNALTNTVEGTNIQAAAYHVAGKYLPYKNVIDKINEAGQAKAFSVSPFGTNRVHQHDELYQTVKSLCRQDGRKYIYSYWFEPDSTMHDKGCYSSQARNWIIAINNKVEDLCLGLEDTLVIVTADHGHCNLRYEIISEHPEIENMMERPLSVECRAAGFYIKPMYMDLFPSAFHEAFGDNFLLLTRQELIDRKLLGSGTAHPKINELAGDYMAIAVSDVGIVQHHGSNRFLSHHAGMTEQEMSIPFIVFESGKEMNQDSESAL